MVNSFDKILYIQYSSIEMPSSVVEPEPGRPEPPFLAGAGAVKTGA